MKVRDVIQEGDIVYSAANGEPMKVIKKEQEGFETEQDYFDYDEHGQLFWLTLNGYLDSKGGAK